MKQKQNISPPLLVRGEFFFALSVQVEVLLSDQFGLFNKELLMTRLPPVQPVFPKTLRSWSWDIKMRLKLREVVFGPVEDSE